MAAPPPVLILAVEKGPRQGETRQCRAGAALRVVKGNDLAVRDKGASQQHLAIEFLPPPAARWVVSDLGSSSGTLLNGARLVPSVPTPLSHGDLIKDGDSTVLAVSIAPDSDPNPGPSRRSSRHAAAVVPVVEEEMPPVLTRRGTRKKAPAPAENPDAEKEEVGAASVMVEEKPRVVTRRGGRKKAAAADPPGEMEEAAEATRRGVQKKAAEHPEPEKDDEQEESAVVTRRGRQKTTMEPPEPEKEEDEEAQVVTRRGGRKKDAATVAPPLLPPKTRTGRGRARVTRAIARNTVLDEEDQGGNELVPLRARTGNPPTSTASNGGEEKGDHVAAGDGEPQRTAKALEEEVPKGRASAQCAASDNGESVAAEEPHEETEDAADATHRRGRKKAIKPPEPEKEEEKEDDAAVATRCGGRKKAVVVTCRSGRKKDEATIAPLPLPAKMRSGRGRGRVTRAIARSTILEEDDEEEQEENEVAVPKERIANLPSVPAVNGGEEESRDNVAAVDGDAQGTAKALEEEVPKGRANAAVAEPPQEMEEAAEVTRRGVRKKAAVVTRRGGRKKDAATIAPTPMPAKTRSRRGRGRVTRASARNTVLEEDDEEEQEQNEVAVPREQAGNLPRATAANVGQDEKGDNVAAGDGEAQGTAKALEEEVPVLSVLLLAPKGRASAQRAASGNGGEEEQGGSHCSSRADSGSNGIPNTTSKYREDRKLKAHSTPFDVRLDRALKKYSA